MIKGKQGPEGTANKLTNKTKKHLNQGKTITTLISLGMILTNSNHQNKMTNSPFLISKFLKFYGEESDLPLVNSNISSNIKVEATCTATGWPNLKSKHLADLWKTKSTASTKPSISNSLKETMMNKPLKRENISIKASLKSIESSLQLRCSQLFIKKR